MKPFLIKLLILGVIVWIVRVNFFSGPKSLSLYGNVAELSDTWFTLQMEQGNAPVAFDKEVKFQKKDADVGKSAMKNGLRVHVLGIKRKSGDVLARQVILNP